MIITNQGPHTRGVQGHIYEMPLIPTMTLPIEDLRCGSHKETDGGQVSDGLVAMGTLLVVGASFISCFGVNLQKWAHNLNDARGEQDPETRISMVKDWRWWSGIICMILGSIMDMAALPFVPLSRVAALGASTIVANIIITPLFLKEKLTKHDFIGCIVTVTGTGVACYFGAGSESELDSSCLLEYFIEPLFIAYGACIFIFLSCCYYFIEGFRRLGVAAAREGIVGGQGQLQQLETVWIHENLSKLDVIPPDKFFKFVTSMGPQFYPCVHAVYAGTIGAQSVMFAKAVLTFLGNSIRGEETVMSVIYLFLFLIPTTFCLWNQIQFLNVALKIYCDAIFVLPVYQAMWICTGIGSGLIFYQEYRLITGLRVALFSGGITMALIGLAVLANRKSKGGESRNLLDDAGKPPAVVTLGGGDDDNDAQATSRNELQQYNHAAGAACVSNGSRGEINIQYSPAIGPIEVFSSPSHTHDEGSEKEMELSPTERHRTPRAPVSVDEIELNDKTLLQSPVTSDTEKA